MTRIAIIGIVGLPANYGGFERFAEQLVQRLWDNYDLTVFCQKSAYQEHPESFGRVHLRYLPLKANGIWSILYDMLAILKSLRFADTLLILGVSGCVLLPLLRWLGCRRRIVVNIDGLEWRRVKWSGFARWFLHFSEKCAVAYADEVIGDNQCIVDYVNQSYGKPCRLIEYGADNLPASDGGASSVREALPERYAFGVCRIEPENNIHLILEAFASGECGLPLVMVGNWHHNDYSQELWKKYHDHPGITLHEAIYDQEALNALRSHCALYLHGHSCGGTNPSLVEAMYLKLPIVAYDCNFNRETTENQAMYFKDATELRRVICGLHHERAQQIAEKMKEIADRRYTWAQIARKYQQIF